MPEPPKGYRFTTDQDHLPELARQGKLSRLCICGHTLPQHEENSFHRPCLHCTCRRFRWKAYLARDPQPTPEHPH